MSNSLTLFLMNKVGIMMCIFIFITVKHLPRFIIIIVIYIICERQIPSKPTSLASFM